MARNFVILHDDLGLIALDNFSIVELTDDAFNLNMRAPDGSIWYSVADISMEGWEPDEQLNEWTVDEIRQFLVANK